MVLAAAGADGNQLLSVKFVDGNTGYAAGKIGTIIKTTNSGVNWFVLNSGINVDIYSLSFRNINTGYVSGIGGTILKTTNGGISWIANNRSKCFVRVIDFPTDNAGYAVGNGGVILKTINGGNNWYQETSGTGAVLYSLSFTDTLNGIAGAMGGILQTTNGGKDWSFNTLGINPMTILVATQYINYQTAYSVDDGNGFYKTTNRGLNWQLILLNIPLNNGSNDIARGLLFINKDTGFIVTDLGRILRTTNSGDNWKHDSTFKDMIPKQESEYYNSLLKLIN
ncbi:MAG: hypothetical protein IPI04_12440 [Ignavibacteria bacterium]|nr:hypothetical protein [Ignavibacteria bacterium]